MGSLKSFLPHWRLLKKSIWFFALALILVVNCNYTNGCEISLGEYGAPGCVVTRYCRGIYCNKGIIKFTFEFDCESFDKFFIIVNQRTYMFGFNMNETLPFRLFSLFLSTSIPANNSHYIYFKVYSISTFCNSFSCYKLESEKLIPSNIQSVCQLISYSHMRNLQVKLENPMAVPDNSINLQSALEMADLYQRGLIDNPGDQLGIFDEHLSYNDYINAYSDVVLNMSAPVQGIARRIVGKNSSVVQPESKANFTAFENPNELHFIKSRFKLALLCVAIVISFVFLIHTLICF